MPTGRRQRVAWLRRFYFGNSTADGSAADVAHGGLQSLVDGLGDIDAREVNTFDISDGIVLRVGRYGPYVQRGVDGDSSAERASVPEDLAPDELTIEKARELLTAPSGDRELGRHPESGLEVVAKAGRYGPYVAEVLPDDARKSAKPKTGSLLKTMSLETVTIEDAVRLLALPRVVGVDPESRDEITAQNGRYGPYLKKGTDSRSLQTEEQIFDITLDEALAIYAQRKQGARRVAAPPLRELGNDPSSNKPVVVKDGRFGSYVTDGETNATLRQGDSVEKITIERAAQLLADRRARGPAPKKRGTKKAAKAVKEKPVKKRPKSRKR